MAMPEAAVHEDDCAKAGECEIWPARQILPVNSKPQPARVKTSPHEQFGLGVTAADAAHVERSLLRCENVDHDSAICQAAASPVIVRSARTNSAIAIPGRIVTAPKRNLPRYSG